MREWVVRWRDGEVSGDWATAAFTLLAESLWHPQGGVTSVPGISDINQTFFNFTHTAANSYWQTPDGLIARLKSGWNGHLKEICLTSAFSPTKGLHCGDLWGWSARSIPGGNTSPWSLIIAAGVHPRWEPLAPRRHAQSRVFLLVGVLIACDIYQLLMSCRWPFINPGN